MNVLTNEVFDNLSSKNLTEQQMLDLCVAQQNEIFARADALAILKKLERV